MNAALLHPRFLHSDRIHRYRHVRELPSSAEGPIKTDETGRDCCIVVGKINIALEQVGLCRDYVQELDRPLLVALLGCLQRVSIFSDGLRPISAPTLPFAIG